MSCLTMINRHLHLVTLSHQLSLLQTHATKPPKCQISSAQPKAKVIWHGSEVSTQFSPPIILLIEPQTTISQQITGSGHETRGQPFIVFINNINHFACCCSSRVLHLHRCRLLTLLLACFCQPVYNSHPPLIPSVYTYLPSICLLWLHKGNEGGKH